MYVSTSTHASSYSHQPIVPPMPFPLYIPTSYPSLSFSNPLAITFSEFLNFDVLCQGQPVHKVELGLHIVCVSTRCATQIVLTSKVDALHLPTTLTSYLSINRTSDTILHLINILSTLPM